MSEEAVNKLYEVFLGAERDKLRDVVVHLWIGFFGPREVYRELKLQYIDEKTAVFALYSIRLDVRGDYFTNHLTAVEVSERHYIDVDIISELDFKRFLDSAVKGEYPRVIVDDDFKERYGIPKHVPEYEIRVVGFTILD